MVPIGRRVFCVVRIAAAISALTLVSSEAQAMMLAKYERISQLGAAFAQLSNIAALLSDPIDKIEYVGDEFRFSAAKCFVPVIVTLDQGTPPSSDGGTYHAAVGKVQCQ